MKEKTKGKILGAAFIVLMACVAGFVLAQTQGDSTQQTQPVIAGGVGLASEEPSTGEAGCVDCPGFQDDDGDEACINDVCEYDGFDGSGYFCSDGTKCVNDYDTYDYGTWHCEGSSWAKQCEANGDWGTQTNCYYGCDEGTGCIIIPPQIANQNPADDTNILIGSIQEFTFTVWNGSNPLQNVSLYTNLDDTWQITTLQPLTGR